MMVHCLEFVAGELPRLLRLDEKKFRGPLTIQFVKLDRVSVLLPGAESVASLALKLNVPLVPPGRHTRAAHKVARIDLGEMSDRPTREARPSTGFVRSAKADEL